MAARMSVTAPPLPLVAPAVALLAQLRMDSTVVICSSVHVSPGMVDSGYLALTDH